MREDISIPKRAVLEWDIILHSVGREGRGVVSCMSFGLGIFLTKLVGFVVLWIRILSFKPGQKKMAIFKCASGTAARLLKQLKDILKKYVCN